MSLMVDVWCCECRLVEQQLCLWAGALTKPVENTNVRRDHPAMQYQRPALWYGP